MHAVIVNADNQVVRHGMSELTPTKGERRLDFPQYQGALSSLCGYRPDPLQVHQWTGSEFVLVDTK